MLVFAVILLVISLPAALVMAFIQLPNSGASNLPPNFVATMRVGMTLFYGMVAALGGIWLYLFNKRSVKAQFRVPGGLADLAVEAQGAESGDVSRPRPISIAIIGWFLLASSALAPIFLLGWHAMFPGVPLPLFFLGIFFSGRSATIVIMIWMAAQIVAAVGLLKLKNWGRLATIGLQCLAIVNGLLLLGSPNNRARFQQIMDSMTTSMNARKPQPVPFVFPTWMNIAISLPIIFVILWFLVTRKQAFTSTAEDVAGRF